MIRFACFLCFATLGWSADWSTLYDDAKLKAEQPRLQTAVDYLIQKEIQPFVPSQEAAAFGLQNVDLPVESLRSDPLDFYARNHHIILPVRTLLFLEDLSRAYGWMWANRFSTKTVDEYLNMIRYRNAGDFPQAKYPPPLEALHIPENALSDPKVIENSVRLRRTAYTFILLHQFGHLQLHHEANLNQSYTEPQEAAADAYALNIMKENSVTPTGILLVMYSSMNFESARIAFHRVTPARMEAIAHFMDAHVTEFVHGRPDKKTAMDGIFSIASLLMEGSQWLTVHGHREGLEQLAMKTDPGTLLPRPLPKSTR